VQEFEDGERLMHAERSALKRAHLAAVDTTRRQTREKLVDGCNEQCALFDLFVREQSALCAADEDRGMRAFWQRWNAEKPAMAIMEQHIAAFNAESCVDKSVGPEVQQISALLMHIISAYERRIDQVYRNYAVADTRALLGDAWSVFREIEKLAPRSVAELARELRHADEKERRREADRSDRAAAASASVSAHYPTHRYDDPPRRDDDSHHRSSRDSHHRSSRDSHHRSSRDSHHRSSRDHDHGHRR
jgi:hypothetical protein